MKRISPIVWWFSCGPMNRHKAVIVPGLCKTRLDLAEPFMEWYLHDGLGSVVQLTDGWGNLTQEYWYEPFGGLQNGVKDTNNRYRFVGLVSDDDLGLAYMNARWYDPMVGRFASRDPVEGYGATSKSLNPYDYVWANPILLTDKTGRLVQKCTRPAEVEKGGILHTVVQFKDSKTECNGRAYGLVPLESAEPPLDQILCVPGFVKTEGMFPDESCRDEPGVNEGCACRALMKYSDKPPDYCLLSYDCRHFAAEVIDNCTGASDELPISMREPPGDPVYGGGAVLGW